MSLQIDSITISDSLDNISRTATVVLKPSERVDAPLVEYVSVNDSTKLASTDLRPDGSVIALYASHNNVPSHEIFHGQVEFIDDLQDPNLFEGTIQLSQLPAKHPQRTKFSQVWNNTRRKGTRETSTTAHKILQDACNSAGIPLGRVDLPDYQLVGTYEAFNQSVVAIAEDLIGPFNAFEFLHYYIQVDDVNGLQIIAIDYSAPDPAIGFNPNLIYEIPNVASIKRSYDMYMPDNRIGSNDILLTGGDRLIPKQSDLANIVDNDEDGGEDPDNPGEGEFEDYIELYTFLYQFKSGETSATFGSDAENTYAETTRTIELKVETVNLIGPPEAPYFGRFKDLEQIIATLQGVSNAPHVDVRITSSKIIEEMTDTYVDGQHTQRQIKTFNYSDHQFVGVSKTGTSVSTTFVQNVLDSSIELTLIYVKSETPSTKVVTEHFYDKFGNEHNTVTKTYTQLPSFSLSHLGALGSINGGWGLSQVDTSSGDTLDDLESSLKFALDLAQLGRGIAPDTTPQEHEGTWNDPFQWNQDIPIETYNVYLPDVWDTMQVVPYQTLNGQPFLPESILNPGGNKGPYIQSDTTATYTSEELRLRKAFHLDCPHMTFAGLNMIYQLCLRQRELENLNAYWENTQVTALIDTTLAAGGVVQAGGSVGIVEDLTHRITANEATTSVSIRRLIVPGATQ